MPKKYTTYVMNSFMYLNGKLPDDMNIEICHLLLNRFA